MNEFMNINTFGKLITSSGKKLEFKDFDKNNDGTIDTEEYNNLLKEVDLDTVDFGNIDQNGDKVITDKEFTFFENKIKMQDEVNKMQVQISQDFTGANASLGNKVLQQLGEFLVEYVKTYASKPEEIVENFKKDLPLKYEEIKTNMSKDSPESIKSVVIDNIINNILNNKTSKNENQNAQLSESIIKAFGQELEKEANNFIKNYNGNNLVADLTTYLKQYLLTSDSQKLENASNELKAKLEKHGVYIDANELKEMKEDAKEFLQQALKENITLKLGNTVIRTENAINYALKSFDDGDKLKSALLELINNLSVSNKLETIAEAAIKKEEESTEKIFTNIKGETYKVNASIIDYSGLIGYHDNGEIYERGKGWGGSRDKAFKKGQEYLQNETIKNQLKSQITDMLKAKGIPFSKIENVFNNVYTQAINDTLNTEGIITGRGARGLRKKGKAHINIKNLVDNFIQTFNKDIAKAIDDMNKSNKDMDIIDIDYTQAGKDQNGKAITDEKSGKDLSQLYATGETITVRKNGADYFVPIAEKMIERLKPQLKAKAERMCNANGVKFDEAKFNAIFNNSKSQAIYAGTLGINKNSHKGTAIGLGSTAAVGTTATIGAATASTTTTGAASILGISAASSTVPVVGWIAAGVTGLSVALAAIFGGGHHSESSLNTRTLLNTFATEFQKNFTAWVNDEAGIQTKNPKKPEEPEEPKK